MTIKLSTRMIGALYTALSSTAGHLACEDRTGEALVRRGYAVKTATRRGYRITLAGWRLLPAERCAWIVEIAHVEAIEMNAATVKVLVGAEPIQARRVAAVSFTAADFVMVRESGGRAHIEAVAGTAALCGEPAVVIASTLNLALVDCLACLDRYTETTRKACLTY